VILKTKQEVEAALIKAAQEGRFWDAAGLCHQVQDNRAHGLSAVAQTLSATAWLVTAESGAPEEVRSISARILDVVARVSPKWKSNANPKPLNRAVVPADRAGLESLLIRILEHSGYYHPIRTSQGLRPPSRPNARMYDADYYADEWRLVRDLVGRAVGLPGNDRMVLELGPAEGFFSVQMAEAGFHVSAIERDILMLVRACVFAVLAGTEDRLTPVLGYGDSVLIVAERNQPDLILALGVIYHFNALEGELETLLKPGVPVVLEFQALPAERDADYDPASHRDPNPVSERWLTSWLEARGWSYLPEPRWTEISAGYRRSDDRRNVMALALPPA